MTLVQFDRYLSLPGPEHSCGTQLTWVNGHIPSRLIRCSSAATLPQCLRTTLRAYISFVYRRPLIPSPSHFLHNAKTGRRRFLHRYVVGRRSPSGNRICPTVTSLEPSPFLTAFHLLPLALFHTHTLGIVFRNGVV